MVAQEKGAGALARRPHEAVDDALRVRTPIDVVADEDQAVVRFEREPVQQLLQHLALAVNVPDGVEHSRTLPERYFGARLQRLDRPSC